MLTALLKPQSFESLLRRAVIEGDTRVGIPALPIAELRNLYARMCALDSPSVAQALLHALHVRVEEAASTSTIPASGPAVIVANHPFGFLDGAVLLHVLLRARPDVRLFVNSVLRCVPGMEEHCIFVDPFSNANRSANAASLRAALRWLRNGGLLATFPAGEVAHLRLAEAALTDPPWAPTAAWLAQQAGCDLIPIFFEGQNSIPFHILGLIHPSLRTLCLPQELLNKKSRTVRFGIGSPLPWRRLKQIGDLGEITAMARWRTYSVSNRLRHDGQERRRVRREAAIAPPDETGRLEAQLQSLREEGALVEETDDYQLLLMRGCTYSAILYELGRAREKAFRAAGEGSGKAVGVDSFDQYYDHLFLWHKAQRTIAGAYRMARTSDVLARYGVGGLYTSTLFRFRRSFFKRLGPAVELGRSFVATQFQKQYAPLHLLWRGIGEYLARHAKASTLFGAVSISRDYTDKSRELITTYFKVHNGNHALASLVRPKSFRRSASLRPWELKVLMRFPDVDTLSSEVAHLEPDGKGLPVLIRQYARFGGRLLAFNLDTQFSNVIDGLVVVDLKRAEPAAVARYIGRERFETICGNCFTGS
jgi:putative hemolysin